MCKTALLFFSVAALIGLLCPSGAADEYATADELGLMKGFPPPPDKRVTKANALLTPPFNRYAYLHMRLFYPTAAIPAGPG